MQATLRVLIVIGAVTAGCILTTATGAFSYGGGGSDGGDGMNTLTGVSSTEATFVDVPDMRDAYTKYSTGIHDKESAQQAMKDWTKDYGGINAGNSVSEEQLIAGFISSIAWSGEFPPKTAGVAMYLESMIEDGAMKPTQALAVLQMLGVL